MKNLFKSEVTFDTKHDSSAHNHSNSALHNCPTCRCPTPPRSNRLSASRSQPYLRPLPSLYLSSLTPAPTPRKTPLSTLSPLSPLSTLTPRIRFNYSREKSPPATITFSYVSPSKVKKGCSSESRFNTRKFKDRHFPHLHNNESDHEPVKKIVKNSKSPYYELFTSEKTPEKHKVLKMNKSKQKLQITLSKKSSNKSLQGEEEPKRSQEEEQEEQEEQKEQKEKGFNDYEFNGFQAQRRTPINALWMGSQSKQEISSSQIIHYRRQDTTPPSIANIQEGPLADYHYILPQIPTSSSTYIPHPTIAAPLPPFQPPTHHPSLQIHSNRPILPDRSPTLQSVQVYESRPYLKSPSERRPSLRSEEQTSLNLNSQGASGSWRGLELFGSERELARSISEQLQLHFDYYSPEADSDRSLSLQVAL